MKQILIADDTESILKLLSKMTQEKFLEYGVQSFPDGTSLKNKLEGKVEDVRLVVTDNTMPGMTGSEIIRQYAKESKFERIPFVLFYGGDDEIGQKAIEDGAYAFVIKPKFERYFEILHEILDARR